MYVEENWYTLAFLSDHPDSQTLDIETFCKNRTQVLDHQRKLSGE